MYVLFIKECPLMNNRTQSPVIETPEDLGWALDYDQRAKAIFEKLPYSHRKEYVTWIESARKRETRARRVEQAIEMMIKGKLQI